MIHADILEYVRQQLSLTSLNAGLQRATTSTPEQIVDYLWIAIDEGSEFGGNWGIAMLYSNTGNKGFVFNYQYHPHIVIGQNETGIETRRYIPQKSSYSFSNPRLVRNPNVEDYVRNAFKNLKLNTISDEAAILGDIIDIQLYVSAKGGMTFHYSYKEAAMEVDDSIEKLDFALHQLGSEITSLYEDNNKK